MLEAEYKKAKQKYMKKKTYTKFFLLITGIATLVMMISQQANLF